MAVIAVEYISILIVSINLTLMLLLLSVINMSHKMSGIYGRHFYVKSLIVSAGPPLFCSRPPAVFRQVPRHFQQVTRCFSAGHPLLYSRGPAVVAAGDCYTS